MLTLFAKLLLSLVTKTNGTLLHWTIARKTTSPLCALVLNLLKKLLKEAHNGFKLIRQVRTQS